MCRPAAELQESRPEDAVTAAASAALEEITAAARRVGAVTGNGSAALLAGALGRLAEATQAVEELTARKVMVSAVRGDGYADGYADGLRARASLRAV